MKYEILNSDDNTLFKINNPLVGINFSDVNLIKNKFINSYVYKDGNYIIPNKLNICVHIRRGDAIKNPNVVNGKSLRFIPTSFYENLIENINNTIDDNYVIHICSDGELKHFSNLPKKNVNLLLNKNEFKTYDTMVKCDILIMGPSLYSISAGLLNQKKMFGVNFLRFVNWLNKKYILSSPNDIINLL